jgi:uncharacterized protein (DUF1778 family)
VAQVGTARSERDNLGLDAATKARIERAAAAAGSTGSGLIVTSALRSAKTVRDGIVEPPPNEPQRRFLPLAPGAG